MSEEGIGVGDKGTIHFDLKELGTSALDYIETGGAGMGFSSDLVHREGFVVNVDDDIGRSGAEGRLSFISERRLEESTQLCFFISTGLIHLEVQSHGRRERSVAGGIEEGSRGRGKRVKRVKWIVRNYRGIVVLGTDQQ